MKTDRFFDSAMERDAQDMRETADLLDRLKYHENALWLRRVATRHEVIAGAYKVSGVEREAGAGARQLRLALPLTVRELQCTDHRGMGYIIDDNGLELAYGDMALSMEQNRDIAAEIVRAVNAHADLLAALEEVVAEFDGAHIAPIDIDAMYHRARAAIARATGVS